MYENSLNLLKTKGIEFERGLTLDELKQIDQQYLPDFIQKHLSLCTLSYDKQMERVLIQNK